LLEAFFDVGIVIGVDYSYGPLGRMHGDQVGVEADQALVGDPAGTHATGVVLERASEWVIVVPSLRRVCRLVNELCDHCRQADSVGEGLVR